MPLEGVGQPGVRSCARHHGDEVSPAAAAADLLGRAARQLLGPGARHHLAAGRGVIVEDGVEDEGSWS